MGRIGVSCGGITCARLRSPDPPPGGPQQGSPDAFTCSRKKVPTSESDISVTVVYGGQCCTTHADRSRPFHVMPSGCGSAGGAGFGDSELSVALVHPRSAG